MGVFLWGNNSVIDIFVGPGNNPAIDTSLGPGVSLLGESMNSTILQAAGPNSKTDLSLLAEKR